MGVHLVAHSEVIIVFNGIISTDQTGQYLIISQKGNQSTIVLYSYDSNTILAMDCKSGTGIALTAKYNTVYT